MNKQIATTILASITILVIIAALAPLISVTIVPVNQSFLLYGFVKNHEGHVEDYQLLVKVGNQTTLVSNSTYANAPVISTYWQILSENETWTFPMNLSLNHAGNDTRIIFELWSYDVPSSSYEYTGLWDQIWLNVTA